MGKEGTHAWGRSIEVREREKREINREAEKLKEGREKVVMYDDADESVLVGEVRSKSSKRARMTKKKRGAP
jgi:hypothetical protein